VAEEQRIREEEVEETARRERESQRAKESQIFNNLKSWKRQKQI
jgi:hypothetical protein